MSKAALVLYNTDQVTGKVVFKQENADADTTVYVDVTIKGSSNQDHGFHVHQYGDLSNGCTSAGAHFNPTNQKHGSRDSSIRHLGDIGNITSNKFGECNHVFKVKNLPLFGCENIVGRALVIHALKDDLGVGGDEESTKTGNAGKRLACNIIAWCNPELH